MNLDYYRMHQPANLDLVSQLASLKFVLFDLETTGFHAHENDQVTQIGAAIVDGSTLEIVSEPYDKKIKLNDFHYDRLLGEVNHKTPPGYQSAHWILALNGYHPLTRFSGEKGMTKLARDDGSVFDFEYDKVVRLSKEELAQVQKEQGELHSERVELGNFTSWVGGHGVTMALGHNANNFDKPFLNFRLEEVYGMDPMALGVIDTMWLARLLLIPAIYTLEEKGVDQAKYLSVHLAKKRNTQNLSSKLQDLRSAFRIEGGLAHDAFGDITTNLAVLKSMSSFLLEHKDLLESDDKFQTNKNLVFHKHKEREFKY